MILKTISIKPSPFNVCNALQQGVSLFLRRKEWSLLIDSINNDYRTLSDKINYLKNFDYIADGNREQFRAPWIVTRLNGADCDDIAIFTAMVAIYHNAVYRFIVQKVNTKTLHVLTEIKGYGEVDPFGNPSFENIYMDKWRG